MLGAGSLPPKKRSNTSIAVSSMVLSPAAAGLRSSTALLPTLRRHRLALRTAGHGPQSSHSRAPVRLLNHPSISGMCQSGNVMAPSTDERSMITSDFPSGYAGAPSTPAEVKAARGPSPDDPLEDPAAPTWVDGFNRSLDRPTINAADGAPWLPQGNAQLACHTRATTRTKVACAICRHPSCLSCLEPQQKRVHWCLS